MAKIILLNGCSSSGKSTIARELIKRLPKPYLRLSTDQLIQSGILPLIDRENKNSEFYWHRIRNKFFDGFHRHIKAFADADNDVIVDHIIEFAVWGESLRDLLKEHDLVIIGVHCDLVELEKREKLRGDRTLGEARSHLLEDKIHSLVNYDVEIDTTSTSPEICCNDILDFLSK